jgi:glycosyltransferase involved in cell wall biosynthesis
MRLCLVTQEYPPDTALGGIGSQTMVKARGLAALGHEVDVLSAAGEGTADTTTEGAGGVAVHRIAPPDTEAPIYSPHVYGLAYSWTVCRELRRLEAHSRYAVVDFPDYAGEGFAFALDRDPEAWVPLVVSLHGSLAMLAEKIGWPEQSSDHYRVTHFMEDETIRAADGWLAASASIADFAARTYGVPRDAIAVVHGGVDTEKFSPGNNRAREAGGPGTGPTVLFVGNIALNKGLGTVVDSVLALHARHTGLRLVVAGTGDEDLAAELRDRAAAVGAGDALDFRGFVAHEQLPELYRTADVVAAPSQYEGGVGMVNLEAMASGKPVVGADAGGTPEAIIDGDTGLLVDDPDDVAATTTAIERLLRDGELRARLGRAGRARARDHFSMDAYARRVQDAYRDAQARSELRRREALE